MGAHDDPTAPRWPRPARAAAIVALAVGFAACGARAVHSTATAATSTAAPTRVTVRQQALGTPLAAEVELDCSTPTVSSGGHDGVAIASATAQRWHASAAPGHDWATTVDVAAGATCTATDRPVPPAVLRSVSGGTAVYDGGTLTGVGATADPGADPVLTLVAGAAT